MAKRRVVIGSVLKNKDASKPDYIKLRTDAKDILFKALSSADEKKGLSVNLESKKSRLEGLDLAVKDGKMSPEMGAEIREKVEKMPDFVRFELSMYVDKVSE